MKPSPVIFAPLPFIPEPLSVSPDIPQTCPEHPKNPLQYLCTSCDFPICCDCAIFGSHKGHDVTPIESSKDEAHTHLTNLAAVEHAKLSNSEDIRNGVKKMLADFDQEAETVLNETIHGFDLAAQKLAEKRVEVLAVMRDQAKKTKVALQETMKDIDQFQKCCINNEKLYSKINQELEGAQDVTQIQEQIQNNYREYSLAGGRLPKSFAQNLPRVDLTAVLQAISEISFRNKPAETANEFEEKPTEPHINFYRECRSGHPLVAMTVEYEKTSATCTLCGKTSKVLKNWRYCKVGCSFRLCGNCRRDGITGSARYKCVWNNKHIMAVKYPTSVKICSLCKQTTKPKELYHCVYCRIYVCVDCIEKNMEEN